MITKLDIHGVLNSEKYIEEISEEMFLKIICSIS